MRISTLATALSILVAGTAAQETCHLQRIQRFLPGLGGLAERLAHDGEHLLFTATDSLLTSPNRRVLVLERSAGGWTEVGELAPGPGPNGTGLAAAGGQAFLGVPPAAGGNPVPGVVNVYALDGAATALVDQLVDPDAAAGSGFGASVACDGVRLAVGAPGYVGPNGESGAVYLYESVGGAWTFQERLTVAASEATRLGDAVDVSADVVVAGAPITQVGAQALAGRAVAFRFTGTGWDSELLVAPDVTQFAQFGYDVAVELGRAVVTAPFNYNASAISGSAYVYDLLGTSWSLDEELECPPHGGTGGEFGTSVALRGGLLLVGAPNWLATNGVRGALHLYDRDAVAWQATDVLVAQPGLPFGASCLGGSATLGDGLAFGGPGCSVGSFSGQTAEVYAFGTGSDFLPFGAPLDGTSGPPALDGTGCAVAGFDGTIELSNALAAAPGILVGSRNGASAPLFGGTLHVAPNFPVVLPFACDAAGEATFTFPLEVSTLGETFFLQAGVLDAGAVQGVALTNGLVTLIR